MAADDLHRTQVLLERWQYERLKKLAEQEGASLSEMVRRLLAPHLRPRSRRPTRAALARIAGLGEDAEISGRDHDRALYGDPRRRA